MQQAIEKIWAQSRRKTGFCHFCGNQLQEGEDFALCDVCWDALPEDEE